MDKYIELIAYYGVDWQQTAIANTRYSVVLAVLAVFVGGFIIATLKRRKIVKLIRQVMQAKQQLEKAEQKHEELMVKQKQDQQQIEALQQKIEQAASALEQEKEQHQSILASKDELFIKAASDKKVEIDEVNSLLNEKSQLVEQLQAELDGQKEKIAQFTEVQAKVAKLESQSEQVASELTTVKQQLDVELTNKNEQDEHIVKLKRNAQVQIDRVLDLESQLELLKNTHANEEKQQIETLESERIQLEQVRQEQVKQEQIRQEQISKAKAIAEAEKAIQQQKPEPAVVSEKPEVEIKAKTAEVISKKVDLDVKQNKVENKAELEKPAKVKSKPKKEGALSGVLGWFSSLDNAVAAEPVMEVAEESEDDSKAEDDNASLQVKNIQNSNQGVDKPTPVSVSKAEISKPVIATKKTTNSVPKVPEQEENDFSGKLAEVADKMDSLQEKFKGYFKKK